MNEFVEKDSLENKLRRVRLTWTILLLTLLLLLTIIFFLYLISLIPEPPVDPTTQQEVTIEPFPIDLALISTIFFIIGIITIAASTGMARTYQSNQIIRPIFSSFNIVKTKDLGGIVTINHDKEVRVIWSTKGYFVLTYNNKPVAFAKSTELYWKILYLRHKMYLNS